MKKYDILIIGPVSLDKNIDCRDNEVDNVGGAVIYSGYAASLCGYSTAVFTKANSNTCDVQKSFEKSKVNLYCKESSATCSIKNKYFTEDKEKRECTSLAVCDPFTIEDLMNLSDVLPKIYHFAGLVWGDFKEEIFKHVAEKAEVAVDAQCLLRHVTADKHMEYQDWKRKKEFLKYITYLKTDAVEAEILTGESDRYKAARILHEWGAKEVMVTHNTEVIVYDGEEFYSCSIKSRNLSGRTGRGDTTFAGYLCGRTHMKIDQSLLFATALVSLKMEQFGPFMGTKDDVIKYILEFYVDEANKVGFFS